MLDFLLQHKDFIITSFFIFFFIYYFIRVYYHQNVYKLKKDNSSSYKVDRIGLDNHPINKYLYAFIKEKRIKRRYLVQSHVLSDLYKVPQKEFTLGVYNTLPYVKKSQLKKKSSFQTEKNEMKNEDDVLLDYSSESSISDHESREHLDSLNYYHPTPLYHRRGNKKKNRKIRVNPITWRNEIKTTSTNNLKSKGWKGWIKKENVNKNKNDTITIKVTKSNKLLKNIVAFLKREKLNFFSTDAAIIEKIQHRVNMGYLIPVIKFSKPDNLSNITEENILNEINYFIQQNYARPNEQLNNAINIAKAIEFFLVKKVPLSLLNINWANKRFLLLLERIGHNIPNKYFSIRIEIKTFDSSFFTLSLKFKDHKLEIENKKIIKKRIDLLVAMELIQHFKKYPFLKDVQQAIRDPALSIASPYAKLVATTIPKDVHEELSRHITANKHAIPYQILESHPDFEKFLNKNFIHRYLYTYRHTINVDLSHKPEKILIMYKGKMGNWDDIKDKISFDTDGVTLKGQYGQEGIIDEGVYNWTELKPFIRRSTSSSTHSSETIKKLNQTISKASLRHGKKETTPLSDLDEEYLQTVIPTIDLHHVSEDSDEDDTLTNGIGDSEDGDEIDEKDMIYESLYNIIDDYNSKYKIFSNIYEETFSQNTEDTAEKFIYYDTHMNNQEDPYEHTWGSRYLFEYCSWIISHPRLSGDHAWIRLKTPDGSVYSVGLYRNEKRHIYDQFMFPLRIKPCKYMSPDVSEFWKGYYSTISIEITKEQFEKMKAKIEEDQRLIEYRPYQAIKANCVTWASDVAAVADIYFPSDLPLIKIIFNNIKVQNIGKKIFDSKYMSPYFLFFYKLWASLVNMLVILFGASMVDKKFKENKDLAQIEPFIRNIKDIADPDKVIIMHPYIIGYYVLNYIKTWRLNQVHKLEKKLNETVGKLKEKKHQYLLKRKDSLQKGISMKDPNYDDSPLAEDIRRYKREIKTICRNIENIKYSIPNKFKKKHVIPEGNLYTQCPLNDE